MPEKRKYIYQRENLENFLLGGWLYRNENDNEYYNIDSMVKVKMEGV